MRNLTLKSQPLTADLAKKAKVMELAGDKTRIRILCALFEKQNVCVSDIAKSLRVSVALVSHHLHMLSQSGLVCHARRGKNICYSLSKNPLINYVRQLICHKEYNL